MMKTKLLLFGFISSALFIGGCDPIVAQKILAEQSFTLEGIHQLSVRGTFCNVELHGVRNSKLHFEGYIKGTGNEDRFDILYKKNGDELEVWVESSGHNWGLINSKLYFEVPDQVEISVNNSSGNIMAENLSAADIKLIASSGNIRADNIGGSLEIRCTSGNIDLDGQMGDLGAGTTSGNIKVQRVSGNTKIVASSGNIDIFTLDGNIDSRCTSGNIRMDNIQGGVKARTSSGNIRGTSILLKADSYFEATSGNITADLLNNEPELRFDLDSSSGNLDALGAHADGRLQTGKGNLVVTGVTSSGNQRYSCHN